VKYRDYDHFAIFFSVKDDVRISSDHSLPDIFMNDGVTLWVFRDPIENVA